MSNAEATIKEHADELDRAASKPNAPAGVVYLAAVAKGEDPPAWAIEDLEERAR